MNTVQSTQEKRTIKVKQFLEDFRAGMSDRDLQIKYHLTQLGLDKFYGMLMDRGVLSPQELQENYRFDRSGTSDDTGTGASTFICPQCLTSHHAMFDICPKCGVSFQAMVDRQKTSTVEASGVERQVTEPKQVSSGVDPVLEKMFGMPSEKSLVQTDETMPQKEAVRGTHTSVEMNKPQSGEIFSPFVNEYDDSPDEVVSGMPLGYMESGTAGSEEFNVPCDGCKTPLEAVSRNVYDQEYGVKALIAAGIMFVVGFLTAAVIPSFSGYSFLRLIVVYSTAMLVLGGTVSSSVGAFLYFAREKAYCCPTCKRVYPRD